MRVSVSVRVRVRVWVTTELGANGSWTLDPGARRERLTIESARGARAHEAEALSQSVATGIARLVERR